MARRIILKKGGLNRGVAPSGFKFLGLSEEGNLSLKSGETVSEIGGGGGGAGAPVGGGTNYILAETSEIDWSLANLQRCLFDDDTEFEFKNAEAGQNLTLILEQYKSKKIIKNPEICYYLNIENLGDDVVEMTDDFIIINDTFQEFIDLKSFIQNAVNSIGYYDINGIFKKEEITDIILDSSENQIKIEFNGIQYQEIGFCFDLEELLSGDYDDVIENIAAGNFQTLFTELVSENLKIDFPNNLKWTNSKPFNLNTNVEINKLFIDNQSRIINVGEFFFDFGKIDFGNFNSSKSFFNGNSEIITSINIYDINSEQFYPIVYKLDKNGNIDENFNIFVGEAWISFTSLHVNSNNNNIFIGNGEELIILNNDGSVKEKFGDLGEIHSIYQQDDGKILLGGVGFLIRIDEQGELDETFSPLYEISGVVYKIKVLNDKIFISGNFSGLEIDEEWFEHPLFTKLEMNGNIDSTFVPLSNISEDGECIDFDFQTDGKIVLVGQFPFIFFEEDSDLLYKNVIRLNNNGNIDETFSVIKNIGPLTIKILNDDSILLGGFVDNYNGVEIRPEGMIKLDKDGLIDINFKLSRELFYFEEPFITSVLEKDGEIFITGNFEPFDIGIYHIVKLNHNIGNKIINFHYDGENYIGESPLNQ